VVLSEDRRQLGAGDVQSLAGGGAASLDAQSGKTAMGTRNFKGGTMPKSDRTVSKELIAENDQIVTGWKNRIREELRQQKLTMKQLSRKAGLGDTTVQYILRHCDTASLETLRRLANALGICVVYLTYGVHRVVAPSEAGRPMKPLNPPVLVSCFCCGGDGECEFAKCNGCDGTGIVTLEKREDQVDRHRKTLTSQSIPPHPMQGSSLASSETTRG
jgi:hypothetical protein